MFSSFILLVHLLLSLLTFSLGTLLIICQHKEYGDDFVDLLYGMFSFVHLHTRNKSFIADQDAIGITPVYMGGDHDCMYFTLVK